jgi:FKBP-type peptidyl-prolyl cis-trans isomerase SlyD
MSENERLNVSDNMVVTMEFTLTVENTVIEDTADSEPIQFLQGVGQILPALEKRLYGMEVGDQKTIILNPEEGYGLLDEEAYADYDRSEFPAEIPLKPGVELQIKDEEGTNHYARIEAVDARNVRLNFNQPLAGKELTFKVRIVALRNATSDEIKHGHAH